MISSKYLTYEEVSWKTSSGLLKKIFWKKKNIFKPKAILPKNKSTIKKPDIFGWGQSNHHLLVVSLWGKGQQIGTWTGPLLSYWAIIELMLKEKHSQIIWGRCYWGWKWDYVALGTKIYQSSTPFSSQHFRSPNLGVKRSVSKNECHMTACNENEAYA